MLFTHTHIDSNDYTALKISNVTIEKAKWVKFLGVCIDEKLKWDIHINMAKKRISTSFLFFSLP